MSIALLCPTRARPEQCRRMIKSAKATASGPLFINLGVGSDWDIYKEMISEFPDIKKLVMHRFSDELPTAHKWNLLAEFALKEFTGDEIPTHYMLCADDVVFSTPCWDKALIDHYNALENKIHVYHLRDGRTGHGTPHPIVTREYIEAMGYFLPPLFMHWFVDTWTVAIAQSANCFTHLTDYMLDHFKPSDEGKPDQTHSRIRDWGWNERDRRVSEQCQHFLEFEKSRLMAHFSKSARAVA